MSSAAPRDSTAFEVREALAELGCPVCRLAVRSVGRWLAAVAYEQVNDIQLRNELRAARGFCNVHAHRWLREVHSVLGTSIVYQDLLKAGLSQRGYLTATAIMDLETTLGELQPTAKALGPALEQLQPFFRNTVAPIRDQLRPFAREARPTAAAPRASATTTGSWLTATSRTIARSAATRFSRTARRWPVTAKWAIT